MVLEWVGTTQKAHVYGWRARAVGMPDLEGWGRNRIDALYALERLLANLERWKGE